MLIASVYTLVFALKFVYPFPLSFFNIECVTGVDFLQDGNGEVSDVEVTLAVAWLTLLLNSNPEFLFCFPNILHLASSLETGHNINYPGRTAVN